MTATAAENKSRGGATLGEPGGSAALSLSTGLRPSNEPHTVTGQTSGPVASANRAPPLTPV